MIFLLALSSLLISLYALGKTSEYIEDLYEAADARDRRIDALENMIIDELE